MPENNKSIKVHYIHRLSSIVLRRIVGIFVLSAVFVIVGLILLQIQSSHLFDDHINYHAYLTNAQGVSTETLVNVSGIEVGRVKAIDITPDNKIHVTFFVYESFQRLLRSDSTGALNKLSVIGNAVIIIKAGSHELPILPADSEIPIEEPVTVEDLMAELTPVISRLNEMVQKVSSIVTAVEPEKLQSITLDLSVFMNNLQKISSQVAEGKGLVGKILYDHEMEQDISSITQNIGPIIQDAALLIKGAQHSLKQVDKILRETELRVKEITHIIEPAAELARKSNKIASDVQTTTQVINREVQQLPEMVSKMQSLLDSTNRTLKNAQQVWPLSTVVPASSTDTIIKGQPLDD